MISFALALPLVAISGWSQDLKSITIDFAACAPGRKRIDAAFGSTTYVVVGKSERECIFRWGGETENPKSPGGLPNLCAVPQARGKIAFRAGDRGLDFSPIKAYCAAVRTE